jgi:uncharacterized protein YndB with AHSA1/START domain
VRLVPPTEPTATGPSATEPFAFSHDIEIAAPAAAVLDYVSDPNTWPEWMPATHHIDSPDRPLRQGDRFVEKWHTRQGEVQLDWSVTERVDGEVWVAETSTPFTGPIRARYTVTPTPQGCRYTRTVENPARPKAPTAAMIERMDAEAAICLANIKRYTEERAGTGR